MQEPLLFNVSIKDNIRYGNDNASDKRVWECAEMANAIQFIESNIEDLDNADVHKQIDEKFAAKMSQYKHTYENFYVLEDKYSKSILTLD